MERLENFEVQFFLNNHINHNSGDIFILQLYQQFLVKDHTNLNYYWKQKLCSDKFLLSYGQVLIVEYKQDIF